jgi:hypothetical protein
MSYLRQATLKVITDTNAAAFETAVNTFLKAQGEEEIISIQFSSTEDPPNVHYVAFIVYTK